MPLEQMGGLRRLAAGLLLAVMLPVGALADAIGTVDTDALVLRKSNSKESKALQTLSRGDTMDILSKSGSWYKVRYGKYTGYVMTQYVTVEGEIEEKEEKSSASSSAGMEGIESIADIGDAPATSRFGDSGSRVVVEEFLQGPEVSVLAFTDGKTVKPMVSSMDHKRAGDGDTGLNTGGMGTIAPNPLYTPEIAQRCMEEIFLPTIRAMAQEGCPFKGCLYFGLMLTQDGPKVIEYNCRFGDPETQVVLPLMTSDLLSVMQAVAAGTLADTPVTFSQEAACCVMVVSGGYPGAYAKGKVIDVGGAEQVPGATLYHSGTALDAQGRLVTAGGRVLGACGVGPTLEQAIHTAYQAAEQIRFQGAFMRRDIGKKALELARLQA